MTRPEQKRAAVDASAAEEPEALRNASSRVEAIAVKICTLVHEHGSPELRAAALALVETVQSERRELESARGPTEAVPS